MPKALAPEISTFPDENAQLIGGTCGACGETVFPRQDHCPNCGKDEMSDVLLYLVLLADVLDVDLAAAARAKLAEAHLRYPAGATPDRENRAR